MRALCVALVAASLASAPAVSAQPLAPGKPAGVREARRHANTGLLIAGGLLAAGLIAVVVYSGSDNTNGVVNPPSTNP